MLTPKQLQEIVETMQPLLDDLNIWITKDIIKRVMARLGRGEDLELTSTDIWQAQVFRDLGGHFEALQRQLVSFTEAAEDEVRQIFQYTGLTAYNADAEMYKQGGLEIPPLRQSPRTLRVLEDTYRRTNGELRNFTRTTAVASQQRLIQALDKAHIMVASGATSYATAVRETVDELVEHQAYVRYPTGHVDTLEVAVLRAVRTGTAQASGNMSMETMEQYGWEIVLTSAHLGARYGDGGENPGNHFWWQGRFFSRTGKDPRFPPFIESTGYGNGEGLCGWNCRHSFGPGDGVHNPWTKYDAEDNKRAYDLSQMQRKKERDIRDSKKKVAAFDEAIANCTDPETLKVLKEARADEAAKLRSRNKAYRDFCDENGLKQQGFRLQVAKAKQQEAEQAYYKQAPMARGDAVGQWPASERQISPEEYQQLQTYAEDRGIKIRGFEKFDGDASLVRDFVDGMHQVAKDFPEVTSAFKGGLQLVNNYQMHPDDYADAGHHSSISINAAAFRDRESLEKDYADRAASGWFVPGTTYKSIAYHEMGHVLHNVYKFSLKKVIGDVDLTSISLYAASSRQEGIAEAVSAVYSGVANSEALTIWQRCGTVITERRGLK